MMRTMRGFKVVRADGRERRDFGWLKTSWLFSFDNYYDANNMGFGAIRVFNDDVIAPGTGFPMHHHAEMEIVTFVLQGELTHRDTAGHDRVISAYEVQRMSAGTGVQHSEFNNGRVPLHMYQIWFLPNQTHLRPEYLQKSFTREALHNKLLPLASGEGHPGAVSMHADATLYGCELEKGEIIEHPIEHRQAFIYLTKGEVHIDSTRMETHDQARIEGEDMLKMTAGKDTQFVLIDMPIQQEAQ